MLRSFFYAPESVRMSADKRNCFSQLTLSWVHQLIQKTRKKTLRQSDLEYPKQICAIHSFALFLSFWNKERTTQTP